MKSPTRPLRTRLQRTLATAVLLSTSTSSVLAASPAASACPDGAFLSGNLALNANFETGIAGPSGNQAVCWQLGDALPPLSAAADWQMHTDNAGSRVCSRLLPGSAPGPGGSRLLHFQAAGNEGGIYQSHALDPTKAYMFSVWVRVLSGQVAIQSRATIGGPVAWTTKIGEWEQLRVCTNSLANTDTLAVFNQAPTGGSFLVDRVELREIAIRE